METPERRVVFQEIECFKKLTTDYTDDTDEVAIDPFYQCHPCNQWLDGIAPASPAKQSRAQYQQR